MTRLILFLLLVAVALLALTALMGFVEKLTAPAPRQKEDTMPATFRTVAYVLLILLMFGVVTGWLGAA